MNVLPVRRLLSAAFVVLLLLPIPSGADGPTDSGSGYWIDVRSAPEFEAGHLDGAIHIPHDEIAERIGEVTDDRDANIHLYCGSGRRAGIARDALRELGYTRVTNEGGFEEIRARFGAPRP